MNKFDELLNKYLDNEISNAQLDELKIFLQEEIYESKLCEIKNVESIISNMKYEKVPEYFSQQIMNRIISNPAKHYAKKSHYSFFINLTFVLLLFIVVAFSVVMSNWNLEQQNSVSLINKIINETSNLIISGYSVLSSRSIVIIGFVVSLILVINFIFNYEGHRNFLRKINEHLTD